MWAGRSTFLDPSGSLGIDNGQQARVQNLSQNIMDKYYDMFRGALNQANKTYFFNSPEDLDVDG